MSDLRRRASVSTLRLLDRVRTIVFSVLHVRTRGAAVLAVDELGRVLLIRQTYGTGEWTLPGGGPRRREAPRAAALREAREEVGLLPATGFRCEPLGTFLRRTGGWSDYVHVFIVTGWELDLRVPQRSAEVREMEQFLPHALPADIAAGVERRIREWQRGERNVRRAW